MGTYGAHFFISGQTTGSAIEFGVWRQSNTTGNGVLYLRQDLAEKTGRGLGVKVSSLGETTERNLEGWQRQHNLGGGSRLGKGNIIVSPAKITHSDRKPRNWQNQ